MHLFAIDAEQKRYRFKPMKSDERKFVHFLAEDYGLDTEAMDREPHRHVVISKTAKFVAPPLKSLAQALAVQTKNEAAPAPVQTIISMLDPAPAHIAPIAVMVPPKDKEKESWKEREMPFNALLLIEPKFGLLEDELRAAVEDDVTSASFGPGQPLAPKIPDLRFEYVQPSGDIVLQLETSDESEAWVESFLTRLKPLVKKTVEGRKLATRVSLCSVDAALKIQRRERDVSPGAEEGSADGWSTVVKGASARKVVSSGLGGGGTRSGKFAVLGRSRKDDSGDGWSRIGERRGVKKEVTPVTSEMSEGAKASAEASVEASAEVPEAAEAAEVPEARGYIQLKDEAEGEMVAVNAEEAALVEAWMAELAEIKAAETLAEAGAAVDEVPTVAA